MPCCCRDSNCSCFEKCSCLSETCACMMCQNLTDAATESDDDENVRFELISKSYRASQTDDDDDIDHNLDGDLIVIESVKQGSSPNVLCTEITLSDSENEEVFEKQVNYDISANNKDNLEQVLENLSSQTFTHRLRGFRYIENKYVKSKYKSNESSQEWSEVVQKRYQGIPKKTNFSRFRKSPHSPVGQNENVIVTFENTLHNDNAVENSGQDVDIYQGSSSYSAYNVDKDETIKESLFSEQSYSNFGKNLPEIETDGCGLLVQQSFPLHNRINNSWSNSESVETNNEMFSEKPNISQFGEGPASSFSQENNPTFSVLPVVQTEGNRSTSPLILRGSSQGIVLDLNNELKGGGIAVNSSMPNQLAQSISPNFCVYNNNLGEYETNTYLSVNQRSYSVEKHYFQHDIREPDCTNFNPPVFPNYLGGYGTNVYPFVNQPSCPAEYYTGNFFQNNFESGCISLNSSAIPSYNKNIYGNKKRNRKKKCKKMQKVKVEGSCPITVPVNAAKSAKRRRYKERKRQRLLEQFKGFAYESQIKHGMISSVSVKQENIIIKQEKD